MYRCILDGVYFRDKKMAFLHLRIEHNFADPDESLLREVEFGAEMMPRVPPLSAGRSTHE
jgi:hypothetical protein